MNSNRSHRYSSFFIFSVKSCKFYLLLLLGLCIFSTLIVIFGGGSFVTLIWEYVCLWILRGTAIAFTLFFVGVVWESLQ